MRIEASAHPRASYLLCGLFCLVRQLLDLGCYCNDVEDKAIFRSLMGFNAGNIAARVEGFGHRKRV